MILPRRSVCRPRLPFSFPLDPLALGLCLGLSAVAAGSSAAQELPVFVTEWGSSGSGDGQFASPYGVAVGPTGTVYVADIFNHRVQVFDPDGTYQMEWGSQGTGDGEFLGPVGIAVDDAGFVFVGESGNASVVRIQKFTSTGTFVTKWGSPGSGDGQFNLPRGVAVDDAGDVYVVEQQNNRVQKFTGTGTFVTKWGSPGSGDGDFSAPWGIAVDADGHVYVSETGNHRIQKFTSTGAFVMKWGTGQVNNPRGLHADAAGDILVVDLSHRVRKFTNTGTLLFTLGAYGTGEGQFINPEDVAVDAAGCLYAADTGNNRIQKFCYLEAALATGPDLNEGDAGLTPFDFTVTLSGPAPADVTVDYETGDGSATEADGDYLPATGSIVIPALATSGVISIDVVGDAYFESDETFTVTITAVTGGLLGEPATATGTILNDDDPPPTLGGVITADNAYTFAYGSSSSLTQIVANVENCGSSSEIFSCATGPETYTDIPVAPGDFIYLIAYDDETITQGVLAQFTYDDSTFHTGTGPWQVYASGIDLDCGSQGPSLAVINAEIAKANTNTGGTGSSVGWVTPDGGAGTVGTLAVGEANDSSAGTFGLACTIDATARWIWYDPWSGAPFTGALGEFLIFRRPLTPTPCSDGVDNDGDGCLDYPSDLGCSSWDDDSESEGGCSACADGVDNDGDGCADYPADLGCQGAGDDSEADLGCTPSCSAGPTCDESVLFSWTNVPGAEGYRVYRDGVLVAATSAPDSAHVDEPGDALVHEYSVTALVGGDETSPLCSATSAATRTSTSAPPGPLGEPIIALHVAGPTELSCSSVSTIPCQSLQTHGNLNEPYRVYVLVADVDAARGLAGVQFGIDYDAYVDGTYEGIYMPSWTTCADMAFLHGEAHLIPPWPTPGEGRHFEQLSDQERPEWPLPGSGAVVTWNRDTNCQTFEPGGPGTGAAAVAGYFTFGAYGYPGDGSEFSIIPRPADGLAMVADCAAVALTIHPDKLGRVGFGADSGQNPCAFSADSLYTAPSGCATSVEACGIRFAWNDLPEETGYVVFRDGEYLAVVPANTTFFLDYPPMGVPHTYGVAALGAGSISPQCLTGGPWTLSVPDEPGTGGLSLRAERNPLVPPVGLAFELPAAGEMVLFIYSVAGRVIRSYQPIHRPAGPGQLIWDGRDDGGTRVAPGVYFVRIASAGLTETRRVVVLK